MTTEKREVSKKEVERMTKEIVKGIKDGQTKADLLASIKYDDKKTINQNHFKSWFMNAFMEDDTLTKEHLAMVREETKPNLLSRKVKLNGFGSLSINSTQLEKYLGYDEFQRDKVKGKVINLSSEFRKEHTYTIHEDSTKKKIILVLKKD